MKIKNYKCKCGHDDFFFADKSLPLSLNQKAIYCSYCGKWFKWADKNERNLEMKQETVLDKIREEIEQITDTMGVSYNQYVSKIDVLQIIDKYKAESENATSLCNQCTNERCVFASGICRNDCEFFIAKESEDKE